MSKTPEGGVKADIKAWLEEIGVWYVMPVKQHWGRTGIPDFLCCIFGLFLAIEAKRPGNEEGSTPRQKDEAIAIREAGGIALVISDVQQLKEYCYAHQSIGAQLPSRGSEGKRAAPRRTPHAPTRSL